MSIASYGVTATPKEYDGSDFEVEIDHSVGFVDIDLVESVKERAQKLEPVHTKVILSRQEEAQRAYTVEESQKAQANNAGLHMLGSIAAGFMIFLLGLCLMILLIGLVL